MNAPERASMPTTDIFNFFEYRTYLSEYYDRRKAEDPDFSHRAFLRDAGIAGSVYLMRIIKNERKLSTRFIPHFSQALGHSPREARYFRALVLFCNEKAASRKEIHLREMLALRNASPVHKLEDRKLRFFDKWYYPVVREMVTHLDFRGDFNRLANSVVPRITAEQAEGAINYLLENGFISRSGRTGYRQTEAIISTGPEVNSTIVQKYQKQVLLQCAEALDTVAREERDISSLTLSVSPKSFRTIKEEIQAFRKRLLQIAGAEKSPSLVCLVGMQLLPRSRREKEPRT